MTNKKIIEGIEKLIDYLHAFNKLDKGILLLIEKEFGVDTLKYCQDQGITYNIEFRRSSKLSNNCTRFDRILLFFTRPRYSVDLGCAKGDYSLKMTYKIINKVIYVIKIERIKRTKQKRINKRKNTKYRQRYLIKTMLIV